MRILQYCSLAWRFTITADRFNNNANFNVTRIAFSMMMAINYNVTQQITFTMQLVQQSMRIASMLQQETTFPTMIAATIDADTVTIEVTNFDNDINNTGNCFVNNLCFITSPMITQQHFF